MLNKFFLLAMSDISNESALIVKNGYPAASVPENLRHSKMPQNWPTTSRDFLVKKFPKII